jgi:SsrA-binding protein
MPVAVFPRLPIVSRCPLKYNVLAKRNCLFFKHFRRTAHFVAVNSTHSSEGVAPTAKPQSKKKVAAAATASDKVISQNRKARHNYMVLDSLECGIVLVGSEVKSLRNGHVSLEEAYARIKNDEVWLVGCDIAEYTEANRFNHNPKRPRKLLLHRREVKRFAHRAYEKGLTLVPLEMHFKRGLAKVVLGICRGKQQHDKRQAMKAAQAKRDIQRLMMRRN